MNILKNFLCHIKKIKSEKLSICSEELNHSTGLLLLTVKINGKCTPPIKKDPLELLNEIGHEAVFSKNDFNWIINCVIKNQEKITETKYFAQYVLIKHQFSGELDEPFIVYKDILTDQIYIKAAKEIFSNIKMIGKFNSEDSICIGHIVGTYEAEMEYQFRQKCTKENESNNINSDILVLFERKR